MRRQVAQESNRARAAVLTDSELILRVETHATFQNPAKLVENSVKLLQTMRDFKKECVLFFPDLPRCRPCGLADLATLPRNTAAERSLPSSQSCHRATSSQTTTRPSRSLFRSPRSASRSTGKSTSARPIRSKRRRMTFTKCL